MYKEALQKKLRFMCSLGNVSTERLFELTKEELDTIALAFEQEYKKSKGKSFLSKKTPKNKLLKLKLNIVVDVLETIEAQEEAAATAGETKRHNQKILGLIANKQDEELREKSVDELTKLLK